MVLDNSLKFLSVNHKTIKLTVAFLFLVGLPGLQAQQAILSASSNATGNDGSVSYSVGQVAFIEKLGTTGTITEGVQQPYEILFMEGIDQEPGITVECIVYPNPANAYVMLKIENRNILPSNCQLNNMNGLLLRNINIEGDQTCIPMDDLVPATYFLTVFKNDKALQTYKIIKK